jgi:sugar/nucleoside kinase (ribokinase family)
MDNTTRKRISTTYTAKEFGFKYVISTLRESFSATHNGWKAMIYNGEEFYTSKRYDIDPIIDRVGGGDSFSGLFIIVVIRHSFIFSSDISLEINKTFFLCIKAIYAAKLIVNLLLPEFDGIAKAIVSPT